MVKLPCGSLSTTRHESPPARAPGQIGNGGRLPDAAFLIDHGNRPCHALPPFLGRSTVYGPPSTGCCFRTFAEDARSSCRQTRQEKNLGKKRDYVDRTPHTVHGLPWTLNIAAFLWRLRINESNDDFLISPDEDLLSSLKRATCYDQATASDDMHDRRGIAPECTATTTDERRTRKCISFSMNPKMLNILGWAQYDPRRS